MMSGGFVVSDWSLISYLAKISKKFGCRIESTIISESKVEFTLYNELYRVASEPIIWMVNKVDAEQFLNDLEIEAMHFKENVEDYADKVITQPCKNIKKIELVEGS